MSPRRPWAAPESRPGAACGTGPRPAPSPCSKAMASARPCSARPRMPPARTPPTSDAGSKPPSSGPDLTYAAAAVLAAEGANVVAVARGITGPLTALAPQVHPVSVDLTAADGPAVAVEEAVSRFGGPDILVNVGAVRLRPTGLLSVTDDDWIQGLTINFLAAVRTTRAALPV
ncbi:SDR family NAD(P)-dependent oxidoreductase [Kitasatospora sp. NPDC058115]|uniref:SDR family NAD(P)-dependent oxidoreductase n=1 Tax=Kitasatospora sp. NPDC058115 TaxID=3346347 RepID=UPI0036DC3783